MTAYFILLQWNIICFQREQRPEYYCLRRVGCWEDRVCQICHEVLCHHQWVWFRDTDWEKDPGVKSYHGSECISACCFCFCMLEHNWVCLWLCIILCVCAHAYVCVHVCVCAWECACVCLCVRGCVHAYLNFLWINQSDTCKKSVHANISCFKNYQAYH